MRSEYLWNPRSATSPTFSCRHTKPVRAPEASPLGVNPRNEFGPGFTTMRVPVASTVFMPDAKPYTSNGAGESSAYCAYESVERHPMIERKNMSRCMHDEYGIEGDRGYNDATVLQVSHDGLPNCGIAEMEAQRTSSENPKVKTRKRADPVIEFSRLPAGFDFWRIYPSRVYLLIHSVRTKSGCPDFYPFFHRALPHGPLPDQVQELK